MTAGSGSAPIIDLLTTPLSYSVLFRTTIIRADNGSQPLTVSLSAPYTDYHFQIVFTSSPQLQVLLQEKNDGFVVHQSVLGHYSLGQTYVVAVRLNRDRSIASLMLFTPKDDVKPGNGLLVSSSGEEYSSHIITTTTTAVESGRRYQLSSDVKPLSDGPVGMSIQWIDTTGSRLGLSAQWAQVSAHSNDWTSRSFSAIAPPGATNGELSWRRPMAHRHCLRKRTSNPPLGVRRINLSMGPFSTMELVGGGHKDQHR